MVKTYIYSMAAVFAGCLASCTQEDFPIPEPEGGTQALSITVTDGGYLPDGRAHTRAAEEDYTTTFTAGDACGLYIMDGDKAVVSNLKIVATYVGGTMQWKTAEGTDIYVDKAEDASYYLYYPYQADVTDQVDASAPDDDGFFAPLIEGWQPKTDQSDYTDGYTASDLMTATGTVSGNGITFSMTHRMALAVIELPCTVYKFTDQSIPDYTVQSSAEFTSDAKPCRMADGTYRYLVNSAATAPEIIGIYADGKKEFTITPSALTASSFKTYRIDGGKEESIEHDYTLQAGDFFCSNTDASGWYIIPSDLMPTENDNCIGVVFRTGKDDSDISDYSTTIGNIFHGYVVALTDAGEYQWGSHGSLAGTIDSTIGWNGYHNQRILTEKGLDNYPAAQACANYTGKSGRESAPAGSSGWFLPSCDQVRYLQPYFNNSNSTIRTSVIAAGGNAMSTAWGTWYWSSSEYSADIAWYVHFGNGERFRSGKASTYGVRAILAF